MIEINNLTTVDIDEEKIKNIVEKVLEREGKKGDISIAFVGQGRIRVLNKKYKGKNRVTDVLSFPESKITFEKFRIGPTKKFQGLGEIVICLREVSKNTKKHSSNLEKELARILIHGTLHLLGYEHEKDKGAAEKMEKKQEKYLEEILEAR